MRKLLAKAQHSKLLAVLLAIGLLLGLASPIFAIADPDTAPQVSATYVYEFSDGSVGVLVDTYLDYAVLPTETATEAYLVAFYDTISSTQFKSVAPYTFVDSGYGRNLVWMKFSATEVATLGIDSTDIANYEIWLMGNPTVTSGWAGDPPKTIATIDQWNTTGDMSVLLALRILYYADILELVWSLDMVEATALGNRLTTVGESYFENVIAGCRTLAPGAFSSSTSSPDYISISYNTAFGATATSGTATVVGSPQTLVAGINTVDTGATTGTIIIDLANWTYGTIDDDTGTIVGTPIDVFPGTNTLTVTGAGTFTVDVDVVDVATIRDAGVVGTGMDLTALGTAFGMSRWMISGLVWIFITIIICAGAYKASSSGIEGASTGFKSIMLLFAVCLVGGTLLGLLHPLVSALLLIGYGAFIGYVLFFRSDSLHKGFMFMLWMFIIVSIAGNLAASGQMPILATRLTADITATETGSIPVASTAGYADSGTIIIEDEHIFYTSKDATNFLGTTFNPITRGSESTEAVEHFKDDGVRTKESFTLNASIDAKRVQLTDSAGLLDFLALPGRMLDLMMTFFVLPLDFLGTELAILSYIWMIVAGGMIVGFVITLIGGRRV